MIHFLSTVQIRCPGPNRDQRGFSLVELIIALSVLVIGLGAFLQGLVGSNQLRRTNRDTSIATNYARLTAESLASASFSDVFALYNADAADDPGGSTAPGAVFDVPGLKPHSSDPDGRVGEVRFPTDSSDSGKLTEIAANSDFQGLPRDLNLDGDSTDTDVTADAKVLPALVSIVWRGPTGARQSFEITVFLGGL